MEAGRLATRANGGVGPPAGRIVPRELCTGQKKKVAFGVKRCRVVLFHCRSGGGFSMTNLTNDQVRAYLEVPLGVGVDAALVAIQRTANHENERAEKLLLLAANLTCISDEEMEAESASLTGLDRALLDALPSPPNSCPRCDGTRIEIVRIPDINSRVGFRQEARRCDHKPVQPIHDGKMAAAGRDQ